MARTDWGKAVKKRLIDLDKNNKWLVDEVKTRTGLYFDDAYLSRVLNGVNNSAKIIGAIEEALEMRKNA